VSKDKLITIAGLIFIGVCALIVFIKIQSQYSPPDAPDPVPAVFTPAAATTASTAPTTARPRPRHTVTVTVTTTRPPASTGGEDGP
jgi:hypothetical protein